MKEILPVRTMLATRRRDQRGGAGGCVIGCLVAVALVVLVIALIAYFVMSGLQGMVDEYTEPAPRELPAATLSDEETAEVWARLDAFKTAIESGKEPDPLELTGPEINALLQSLPFGDGARNWIHVDVQGDKLVGEVSLNVGQFIPGGLGAGRYFNGMAEFDVSMEHNLMYVYARKASVKGEPVPDEIMAQLSSLNLADQMATEPQVREYMQMIKRISVEDGVVKVVPESNEIQPAP